MTSTMQAQQPHAVILFLGSLALSCTARASQPQPSDSGHRCRDSNVHVFASDGRDVRDGCTGARAAIAFLAPHASRQIETLFIHVRVELPAMAGHTAAGAYLARCDCSTFVPYASFRLQRTWFKVPISRDLYRSLATHEAAHAAAAHIFLIPSPTIQAKEYVAYVTMFATMDPLLRARALRALPGTGFASEDRISLIYYMFDPMRFGAEAYRHYMKPENGAAFLQFVFAGKALTTE
jgi:hypothetical protein